MENFTTDSEGRKHYRVEAETGNYNASEIAAALHAQQGPIVPDSVADGVYANVVYLHMGVGEFVLDFARSVPGEERAKVVARVALTNDNLLALAQAIEAIFTVPE